MAQIACFILTKSREVEISLRRFKYTSEARCILPFGYHDAERLIASGVPPVHSKHEFNGMGGSSASPEIPKDDPRWPTECACGYRFVDSDQWQYNEHFLWTNEALSVSVSRLHLAPAGAMWDAHWMGPDHCGPDGVCLVLMTPGGEWAVDGPAYNAGKAVSPRGWQRTGVIPNVTANPSILIPNKYHGWLRDGTLTDC